jgi:signal transduction histidine kinase/DNA-binding NarL/FixJ family response regulator
MHMAAHDCSEGLSSQGAALLAMRARLLEVEAQLASVAEAAESGILLFDANGAVRLMNDRFFELVGLSRQGLNGADTWQLLAQAVAEQFADRDEFLRDWKELAENPAGASCDELHLRGPSAKHIERFSRPVTDAEGGFAGRLEVYRELGTIDATTHAGAGDEKLVGAKQLLVGVARELSGPLANIVGYSQLLLGRQLTAAQAADGRLIYQEAECATRTVKNLLLFCSESNPRRRGVDVNEIVKKAFAAREEDLRASDVDLKLNLAAQLPAIEGDAVQLQQAISNLLVNAEQAVRQRGKQGTIAVRTCTAGQRVFLEIADSGAGIPPEIIPRIFDPFFSTKPAGSGTGLGLSVAYGIVQEFGGEISVESKLGRGAKFTVEFPVAIGERLSIRERTPRIRITERKMRPIQRARVLVIEDEPSVAQLIADVLGEEGHAVETVLDGVQGLNRAITGDFDLVMCDLKMPEMNGQAIYRQLAAKDKKMLKRFVFVTGDTLSRHTMEFLDASGVPFLAKPFLVEELRAIVHRVMAAERSENGIAGLFAKNDEAARSEKHEKELVGISHRSQSE